jgi:hypothetical protein
VPSYDTRVPIFTLRVLVRRKPVKLKGEKRVDENAAVLFSMYFYVHSRVNMYSDTFRAKIEW